MSIIKKGIKGDHKYTLTGDVVYTLKDTTYWKYIGKHIVHDGHVFLSKDTLTLREGFHWDGATSAPDFDSVLMASAVHDALIQIEGVLGKGNIDRKVIDKEFYHLSLEDGLNTYIAKLYFLGIRFKSMLSWITWKLFI